MKYAILLPLILFAQDTPPDSPRALINSDFVAAVDSLGTRPAQTNLSVVYFDTARDDQFLDVAALRADVTALIRAVTPATLPPEAFAKAVAKGLTDKYPQIAGLTVTLYLNFNAQGTPQFVTTLTRLAPALPASVKAAVAQNLAESPARRDNGRTRIVR
jgi:hypothetical protein